jgi:cation diffusion facilitator CzcD-associated flavoprotein CzcO
VPEEIDEEGHVEAIPEQEAPVPHEVILADAEPEMPQLRLFHALMRNYEENPLRLEDDFDDLDDDLSEDHYDMDE